MVALCELAQVKLPAVWLYWVTDGIIALSGAVKGCWGVNCIDRCNVTLKYASHCLSVWSYGAAAAAVSLFHTVP